MSLQQTEKRTRSINKRTVVTISALLVAGTLAVGSSRRKSTSTPAAPAASSGAPKLRCSAPTGVYTSSPYGKWIALVRSSKGKVTSYGVVKITNSGKTVRLVGANYHRGGRLKYTWRGVGVWNGRVLTYYWKITGRNAGVNKMSLFNNNARLAGYWFRKGAKGAETFCRAL